MVLARSHIPGTVAKHVIWKYKYKRTNPLDPFGWVSNDPLTVFGKPLPSRASDSSASSSSNSDEDGEAVPSEDEIRWVTTNFRAGDIVVLGLDVIHMSSTNESDFYRISCDTRWLPIGDPLPVACCLTNRIGSEITSQSFQTVNFENK